MYVCAYVYVCVRVLLKYLDLADNRLVEMPEEVCMYVYMCMCCVFGCICMHMCVCIYIYVYTYIHTP